jgi:tyrosyl-tRNA synthetase
MSIRDELLPNYAELAAGMDEFEVKRLSTLHPKQAKIEVAKQIVGLYHGQESANRAAEAFEDTFSARQISNALVEEVSFNDPEIPLIQAVTKSVGVSSSEARRLIEQGGVKLNGEITNDQSQKINVFRKVAKLQVGKRRFYSLHYKK